ncbi:MAG TPA: 30S ribosome-binding factor RbfA [Gaiellaceae bacterium]|nr:30S ribosome-binding factor RbfA [Gaiellaceae bacterium]
MSDRMRRVNESVRQVLAEALPELKDPRIGLVTVTAVETSPDLRQATVYVSVLGSGRKRRASLDGLEAAHGVLQSRLARELRMKRTPQLTFEYDPTVERGVRMTRLIDELAPDDDDADD